MDSNINNMTAINRFLEDIGCLEPITRSVNRINIFKVLKLERNEVRHSNMLTWLMDPNAKHGLGDRVLRGIIQSVDANPPQQYGDFSVRPDSNYIDLLLVSAKEKYVLTIENKTFTGEHDNQLARYKAYVEGTFPGYRKKQIYLSPRGKQSSDPENWIPMSYGDVARIIEEAKSGTELQPEAELYIDNYLEVIRELSGGDEKLNTICADIYRKHRAALDLIFQYEAGDDQPADGTEERALCEEIYRKYQDELDQINKHKPAGSRDPIADIIREWANARTDEGIIEVCPQKGTDRIIRFKTPEMSALLPDVPGLKSAWKTENCYFYEVFNKNPSPREHMLMLQFATGAENIPDDLRKMSDRINSVSDERISREDWKYRVNFVTQYVPVSVYADKETVMNILDGFLQQLKAYEISLYEKLGLK